VRKLSKISLRIKTKPITILLRLIPVPFLYVHGHNFKISISVKNLGPQSFNGGTVNVFVTYAFGNLFEQMSGTIPSVDANGESPVDLKGKDKWGVLANGHALFLANLSDANGNFVPLYDEKSQLLQKQKLDQKQQIDVYHIHSFYSLTRGELYTLIALYLNILLTILAYRDSLIELFRRLLAFLN
jgi:hypothetical protein